MASSADETADPDPKAHCHDRTSARGYRPPRDEERERLEPCGFCFPTGEIDVPEDEILTARTRKSDGRLHRADDSDGTPWKPTNDQDCNVSRTMAREDVTTLEDLAEALEERGA